MKIHHLNCGTLIVPSYPTVVCHCLLLQEGERIALVDTGIGLADVRKPFERLGQPLIELAGFQFHESDTAWRRIEAAGLMPRNVEHIVLTHGDPDHAGGLADFPQAQVHVAAEELEQIRRGHWRYVSTHFAHAPVWNSYDRATVKWFGLPARRLNLGFSSEVLLIPLFGHTLGHCGVAIAAGDKWLFYVGDAYYLRVELSTDEHPVSQMSAQRADDDEQRIASLHQLRRLHKEHADEIEMFGYHDLSELPPDYPLP